jgi:hypothetical protein
VTALDDPLGKAQRRGDTWKRRADHLEADRNRLAKALQAAEQRASVAEAILTRLGQQADAWEQRLPDTIRTAAAVDAIRTTLERRTSLPPLDRVVEFERALLWLRSLPIQCTALTGPVWYGEGWNDALTELEEYKDRLPDHPVDLTILAPILEGLARLIATSSRDWGEYRVDAWLWAVLVGWDCEDDHEHDDLCENGAAMREMAERHGWDDATVSKARRYRNAIRAVTEQPKVVPQ